MKCAKVISICFIPKTKIEKTYLLGEPVGFFGHSQKSDNLNDAINNLNFLIDYENKYNPGVQRDLIIINNDIGNFEGNNYLKKISGKSINKGKIICLNRENIGRSFGAFSYAFSKFRLHYDYYLFSEDDILIFGENYFSKGIEIFNSHENPGFLAYIGKTKVGKWRWKELNLNKETAYTCHGATGLTSSVILEKVFRINNKLPHYEGSNRELDITFGEVGFPSSILKLGFELIDLPKNLILAVPLYDEMRGIKYKKFPSFTETTLYHFKKYIYNIFSINKFILKLYLRFLKKVKF
tara:strand:+ start:1062 stop:1946 length:885 start_codon:yes stop_codon:yes gene_type:complete